jgi:hypothetical protein
MITTKTGTAKVPLVSHPKTSLAGLGALFPATWESRMGTGMVLMSFNPDTVAELTATGGTGGGAGR